MLQLDDGGLRGAALGFASFGALLQRQQGFPGAISIRLDEQQALSRALQLAPRPCQLGACLVVLDGNGRFLALRDLQVCQGVELLDLESLEFAGELSVPLCQPLVSERVLIPL